MGAYRAAVVTAGGENLIAQALADNMALEFTSAKTSSYAYPSGTNIAALTGLQDVEQSVIPSASQVINSNVAQISVRFDNNEVTQTYLIQTIGLYAKVGNGSETLFSVIRAITPDEMPVQSATSPSAFIYNIQHTIQNAAQITMVVNPAGTATVQDILNIENPTFDDSGEVEGISSFPDFLGSVVNKMSLFQFFRNLKAGMGYVLHMGKLVNNGLCDTPGQFALDAAYGKNLQDQLTKLNSDLRYKNIENIFTYDETKLAIHAYVENNCVCITIVMKTTCPPNTEIKFTITDKKYLPRHLIFGAYGSGMSGLDHDKFNSAMIHDDGNCIIYLNDTLSWQEFVSFCYPCRIDQ